MPAGYSVNPNVAVVVPFMCHTDEQTAIDRGIDGAHFFGYSLAHYYIFGAHRPGLTNVWDEFQHNRAQRGFARDLVTPTDAPLPVRLLQENLGSLRGAIGTPQQVTELFERYEKAGIDEVIFVSQAGRNQHEHICESIELFAREVLPAFAERHARSEADKRARLAPAVERALQRRPPARQAPAEYTIWPDHEPWQPATRNGHVAEGPRDVANAAFGWLVKGRTDAQLDVIFGSGAGQRLIFRGMERAYVKGPRNLEKGTLQYQVRSRRGTRSWIVRIADGQLTARPGAEPCADATLRLDAATFARMAAGQRTAGGAAMDGKLQIEGDLRLVARLGAALGQRA